MDQLLIVVYTAILITGSGAIVWTFQKWSSFGYPFLESFAKVILFLNIGLLTEHLSVYTVTVVSQQGYAEGLARAARGVGYLSGWFMVLMFWHLVRTVVLVRGGRIGERAAGIARLTLSILAVFYAAAVVLAFLSIRPRPVTAARYSVLILSFLVSMYFVARMLLLSAKERTGARAAMSIPLGAFYLGAYAAMIIVSAAPVPGQALIVSLIMVLFNLFPFFWLKRYLPGFHAASTAPALREGAMDGIFDKYGFTPREREITGLILQGRSNKEIEAELFISVNTVKNHLYKLYQKLGINSRGQLVTFLLEKGRSGK